MTEKIGIQQSKEVFIFLAKLGVSVTKCIMEKKFKFGEFVDDVASLPDALVGITEVPAELKDIDSVEASEVLEAIMAEIAVLGIADVEAAKCFISAGVAFIEGSLKIYEGVKALKK